MTKSFEISYQFLEATETSCSRTFGCSSCHIVILEAYLLFSGVSVILIVISDSWRLVPLDLYRHSVSHSCCRLQFLHLKSDSFNNPATLAKVSWSHKASYKPVQSHSTAFFSARFDWILARSTTLTSANSKARSKSCVETIIVASNFLVISVYSSSEKPKKYSWLNDTKELNSKMIRAIDFKGLIILRCANYK